MLRRCEEREPFQWSCHLQHKPGADLEHKEWLHTKTTDPRREFCTSLLGCLGEVGSVVVYSHFERTTLEAMSELFPDLSDQLQAIITRLWDLCACVRVGFYHPGFQGSFSIKTVLPKLVPTMSYEGMAIADGMAAVEAWDELVKFNAAEHIEESVRPEILEPAKEQRRRSLLDYCSMDSLAMVRVVDALKILNSTL